GSLSDRLHVARGRRFERRGNCRSLAGSCANREDQPPAGAATLAGGPRSHLAGRSEWRVPLCRSGLRGAHVPGPGKPLACTPARRARPRKREIYCRFFFVVPLEAPFLVLLL